MLFFRDITILFVYVSDLREKILHLLHKIVTVLVELHVESERIVGRTPKAVVLWIATPWVDDFLHHLSIA